MFGSLGLDEAEQTELGKKLARGLVGKVEENDVALLVEPGGSPGGIALFRACKAAFGEYVNCVDASAFGTKKRGRPMGRASLHAAPLCDHA